jgi:hypothetical protein
MLCLRDILKWRLKDDSMSEQIFAQMSDQELKAYVLAHRSDAEALHVYLSRLNERPDEVYKFGDYSALENLLKGESPQTN